MKCCKNDVICARMIVHHIKLPSKVPLIIFFPFFPKNYCMPNNSVTIWDIFMKFYRNMYQIKIVCHIQLQGFLFLSYVPLIVFLSLF